MKSFYEFFRTFCLWLKKGDEMKMEQLNKGAKTNKNPVENEEQVKIDEDDDEGGDSEQPDMDNLPPQVVLENEYENPEQKEEEVDDGAGDETSDIELSDMDNLPTEILVKILDYLDEQELVICRILSSCWNEVCCLLLPDKTKNNPTSKLIVQVKKNMKCTTVITKPVEDFLACFAPSEAEKSSDSACLRPLPFSHFTFENLKYLDFAQMYEFVSTFGPQMKTVFVDIKSKDIRNFERLWRLLLRFAPNIQHLRIIGDASLANVNLPFPSRMSEADPNVKLPNFEFLLLKLLEITSLSFGQFNNFMKDLFDRAPNVQQVSCLDPELYRIHHELDSLAVWQQLGKAHLLKKLEIKSSARDHLSPGDLMKNLRLERLTADCFLQDQSITNCIYHALKSNQETLSSLVLWNLNAESMKLCSKDIASLPNVRRLHVIITNSRETADILERLGQLCPNVVDLNLDRLLGDFSTVAPILWTRFKGLKSLKLEVCVSHQENNSLALDSAISGYPEATIWRINLKLHFYKRISVEVVRRGETQDPSILDLKDLSRLQLKFNMGKRTVETEKLENQLRNSVFIKILPMHIQENPRSVSYHYSPF